MKERVGYTHPIPLSFHFSQGGNGLSGTKYLRQLEDVQLFSYLCFWHIVKKVSLQGGGTGYMLIGTLKCFSDSLLGLMKVFS